MSFLRVLSYSVISSEVRRKLNAVDGPRAPQHHPRPDQAFPPRDILSGLGTRYSRLDTINPVINSLCVFCGANHGKRPAYRAAAQQLGELLARRSITLVYGGGNVGLMGTIADACLAKGGRVIGVIPKALAEKEIAHAGLTEMHVVGSMHERKALMADFADAFLSLPGGFGTWDEFCEALTWSQLGLQKKACAFLNVEGYYDALFALAERAAEDGFIRAEHRQLLLVDTDPERLLDRLQTFEVPYVPKWVDKSER
jgi:uncharacterized protein (TIGR00730 family)